jgi:predicted lysophospholipase L1 biosynthesis ABC-type transport system permease subunit
LSFYTDLQYFSKPVVDANTFAVVHLSLAHAAGDVATAARHFLSQQSDIVFLLKTVGNILKNGSEQQHYLINMRGISRSIHTH